MSDKQVDQVVIFKSDENEFAIDIMQVQEIIRFSSLTKVPNSSPFILGVVNLRGHVLPVVDFKMFVGEGKSTLDKSKRIIIVELENHNIGILVDLVREVMRISEESIEAIPQANHKKEFIKQMIKLDKGERIISLMDGELLNQCLQGDFESSSEEIAPTESLPESNNSEGDDIETNESVA